MNIYGEITKIEAQDDGTIKVVGVASTGAVDDADETVLPEAMKAALPAYMRFGALREMHGLSAAGATLKAEVGEDGVTRIETHVVDPVAVKKVQLGVYRGFSIGGKVLARDPSDRKVITKLRLNEISLVDRPCNPEAVIDMWKADRAEAGGDGPSNAEVIAKATEMAAEAGRRGRHTEFVVKAREALLREREAVEREPEPFLDIEPERFAAFDAPEPEMGELEMFKLGARNSQADLAHIQAAHDHLAALGAQCGDCGEAKAALGGYHPLEIDELRQTVEILQKRLDALAMEPAPPKALAGAARAVSKAEDANPNEPGALSAGELKKYLDGLPQEERGRLQLMAALRQPIAINR
jgi:hypothetical protein